MEKKETRGRKPKAEELKRKEEALGERELMLRFKEIESEKKELKKDNDRLKDEILELKNKIEAFNKNKAFYNNEEDTIKAILDEKAKGKPPILILENLERKGIFLCQEEIDIICENITDLSMDLQTYYNEKRKIIMEMRKVDDSFERVNDIEILNMQLGNLLKLSSHFSVQGKEEYKEYLAIHKEIVNLIKEKGKFNKEVSQDSDMGLSADVKEIKAKLDKRSSNVVKDLDTSGFRTVN